MKVQKLNKRQAKWALYLFRFDFMLKHVLESRMVKVNSLSKRPDQEISVKKDDESKTLVKLGQLEVRSTKKVEVIMEGIEKVKQSKVKNNKVVKAVKEMK